MADATIFTKTLTAGDSKAVILEPGMELLRQTNLPANWRRIRIGVIGSWTNLVSSNGAPNEENIVGSLGNPRTGINFGMSNGVGYFGDSGNKFLGMAVNRAADVRLTQASSNWNIAQNAGNTAVTLYNTHGNGATVTQSVGSNGNNNCQVNNPTLASSCLFGLSLDLDTSLTANGVLTLNRYQTATAPLSDAKDATLNSIMFNTTFANFPNSTGGWWTMDGVTPVDCRFISIRSAFQQNRLIVHNLQIQQIL